MSPNFNWRMSLDKKALGQRLRAERERRGFTQVVIADMFETDVPRVSNWETGKAVPELDKLVALSSFYEVSLHYLITGERAPNSSEAEEVLKQIEEVLKAYRKGKRALIEHTSEPLADPRIKRR